MLYVALLWRYYLILVCCYYYHTYHMYICVYDGGRAVAFIRYWLQTPQCWFSLYSKRRMSLTFLQPSSHPLNYYRRMYNNYKHKAEICLFPGKFIFFGIAAVDRQRTNHFPCLLTINIGFDEETYSIVYNLNISSKYNQITLQSALEWTYV